MIHLKCIMIVGGGNGQIMPDARRPRPCSCYQLFTYRGKLVLRGSIVWGRGCEYLPSVSTAASTYARPPVLARTWLFTAYCRFIKFSNSYIILKVPKYQVQGVISKCKYHLLPLLVLHYKWLVTGIHTYKHQFWTVSQKPVILQLQLELPIWRSSKSWSNTGVQTPRWEIAFYGSEFQ